MKKLLSLISLILISYLSKGQEYDYSTFINKADSLYAVKDYKKSALAYTAAFKANGWKGQLNDRYNAACSWALANNADSSFFQLNKIVKIGLYKDYNHISTDSDLNSLHKDARWKPLLDGVKLNKEKAEVNLNRPLAAQLDSIYNEDQKYRGQIDAIEKEFGWESKEMKSHWKIIDEKDSLNLIKVEAILDKYGWQGEDVVGRTGNSALFLVIQHSNQKTQEKYLPMMRKAVKEGKARGGSLALLEDRVALRQGKKQIYGSQIGRDPETNMHYVLPLEDPDNVDIRRAEVGLQALSDYVSYWQIDWDVEQYKKDLPAYEAKQKKP